jgi:ATP-binding cassette subfamily B protein RaxB
MRASNSGMAALELVIITGLTAMMAIQGTISVGLLFSIVALRQQFRERAYPLIERVLEFKLLHARLQRLSSIVTTPKEYENGADELPALDLSNLSIDIRNLHFQYAPHSALLFEGLDLHVAPGRFIAIKGKSGLGKSTLIRVLLGLVTPGKGRILIGATLLEGATVSAFRNVAAAVMQDDQLFGGTLFDNISGFDPNASIERIHEAAHLACVHDDILAMPADYFGQVGDMGASLSGGQRQRILLARALYRKPRILFLDEGTANLDLACEARIIDNIRQLGITVICVAHRARALEVADEVYELRGGKLVREATPVPAPPAPLLAPAG